VVARPTDSRRSRRLAFKIHEPTLRRKLTYFRVYSGRLEAGAPCSNVARRAPTRIGRGLMMHATRPRGGREGLRRRTSPRRGASSR